MFSDIILEKLQSLPSRYHWALSDYNLLLAIYGNKEVVRTGRLRVLAILLKLSQRIGVAWVLISLIGMADLVRLIVIQHARTRNNIRKAKDYPKYFFVGFGIAREDEILLNIANIRTDVIGRIHQYKIETFAYWHSVDIVSGFRSLFCALRSARDAMADIPAELATRHVDFLTYIGSKVGYYSYVQSWLTILSKRIDPNLLEFGFSCQNLAAFAVADAGIRSTYFSHGMISRCELLPGFDAISALSTYEAAFMQHRLPSAHITVYAPPRLRLIPSQMSKAILITSCPVGGDARNMLSVIPLVRWATAKKVPIRVRLHPSENDTFFWSSYEEAGLVTIEKGDVAFFQAIDRLRPRLLVSWVSTTLADVLECGVIPVSVSVDDDIHVAELVYPIFQRCLRWPKDFESIERLFDDDEYYASVLSRLRAGLPVTVA